jgi:putative ABC transport system substrate-binding protein
LNPNNPSAESNKADLLAAARTLGLQIHILNVTSENDFDAAFATLKQEQASALVVGADSLLFSLREPIVKLAATHDSGRL